MNGVHDMGGMDGFGKVEPSRTSRCFTPTWEARVMALVRAMGAAGAFNIDTSRFYREALPPHVYLSSSYYKKWLLGLENLLVDKGFVAPDEVKAGHALKETKAPKRGKLTLDQIDRIMVRGKFGRPAPAPAQVQGRRPRAREEHPSGDAHAAAALRARPCRRGRARSRLPRVSGLAPRSRRARIRSGSTPWCSTRAELWGADADPTVKISIDAFEPYLEPA